jgi:hypothetical protein
MDSIYADIPKYVNAIKSTNITTETPKFEAKSAQFSNSSLPRNHKFYNAELEAKTAAI